MVASSWISHYRIFTYLKRSSSLFILLNVLFLASIVFLPVPVAFFYQYGNHAGVWQVFALTQVVTCTMLLLMWVEARVDHLLDPEIAPEYLRYTTVRLFVIPLGTLLSVGVAYYNVWLGEGRPGCCSMSSISPKSMTFLISGARCRTGSKTGAVCERRYRVNEQWYNLRSNALAEYRMVSQQIRFWLEWDCGTMNVRDWVIKFASYAYYIALREWAREDARLPRLFCVAPDIAWERRMQPGGSLRQCLLDIIHG